MTLSPELWIGIAGTIAVAVAVFIVQEFRNKKALERQERRLREGFKQDLEEKLPTMLEAAWKAGSHQQGVPGPVRAQFLDFGRAASSTIAFAGTPPAATFVTSFEPPRGPDDEDPPGAIFVP